MKTTLLLTALLLAACSKGDPAKTGGGGSSTGDPAAQAAADDIFAKRCTPCHGATGGGDGSASGSLNPKPRNFHDTAWQGSVTDEHIETIIKNGGAAVGKSPAMPANPDLINKPEVVSALRAKVRSFGGK